MKKFDSIFFILFCLNIIARKTLSDFIETKYISATFLVLIVLLLISRVVISKRTEKN